MERTLGFILGIAVLGGLPTALILHSIVLRMGCGLLGHKKPNFWWACLIGVVAGLLILVLHGVPSVIAAVFFQGINVPRDHAPYVLGLTQLGLLPINMFLVASVYTYLLPAHYATALLLWFFELVTMAFFVGLILGSTVVVVG